MVSLDNPSAVHHGDLLGNRCDYSEIVRHVNHGGAAFPMEPTDFIEHHGLGDHAQTGRGFVKHHDGGFADQGHCDERPLLLSPRELMWVATGELLGSGEVDAVKRRHDMVRDRALRRVTAQHVADGGADAERRIQARAGILWHEGHVTAAQPPRLPLIRYCHARASDVDPPADDPHSTACEPQHRKGHSRFAAARLADDAEDASRRHREGDVVDNGKPRPVSTPRPATLTAAPAVSGSSCFTWLQPRFAPLCGRSNLPLG